MPIPLLIGAGLALAKTAIGKRVASAVGSKIGQAVGRVVRKPIVRATAKIAGRTATGAATAYGAVEATRAVYGAMRPVPSEMPFGMPGGMGGGIVPSGGRAMVPYGGGPSAGVPSKGYRSTIPPDAWARPDGMNVLPQSYLRPYYRAPKGYVVVKLSDGSYVAVTKAMAKYYGAWKPQAKPPISVGDWNAYKSAKKVEKKLRKIAGPAMRKYGTKSAKCSKKR